jgi:farnesyl-diphosphate farnesyltransferase
MMGARDPDGDARALQERLLPGVSRTFALTIPQLPGDLRPVVTNAYLLCRIADTIEDEVALSPEMKQCFHERFTAVVAGRASAEQFTADLQPLLSSQTLDAERVLIHEIPRVLRVTFGFSGRQRAAIERCVRVMCEGMPQFQRNARLGGLADVHELERYCYYVAGVVGEMLTDLFCAHSSEIERRRPRLAPLAASFGYGLQLTNVLKDTWEDRRRGVCWLPRDIFDRAGLDLETLVAGEESEAFVTALDELIGIAHAHLRDALAYTLAVPRRETGIRRFCLWALGLAVLTLRKIHRNPRFLAGRQVKVSRRTVRATVIMTSLAARSDWMLSRLFQWSAAPLPPATP